MTADVTTLVLLSSTHVFSSVSTADENLLLIMQSGHLQSSSFTLPIVHHVSNLALNLISYQLTYHGLIITFSSSDYFMQYHLTGQRIGTGR